MQIEQKKTLTEELWLTLGEGDNSFEVKIDYPVYPHNATLSKLSIDEAMGKIPAEPSWAFYVRSVVKDFRGLFSGDKEYHPKIVKNLLSVEDFEMLMGMGHAETIWLDANKKLNFSELDKKKL